jgi:hypothetical protein
MFFRPWGITGMEMAEHWNWREPVTKTSSRKGTPREWRTEFFFYPSFFSSTVYEYSVVSNETVHWRRDVVISIL